MPHAPSPARESIPLISDGHATIVATIDRRTPVRVRLAIGESSVDVAWNDLTAAYGTLHRAVQAGPPAA